MNVKSQTQLAYEYLLRAGFTPEEYEKAWNSHMVGVNFLNMIDPNKSKNIKDEEEK